MLDGAIRRSLRNHLAVTAGAGVFLVWDGAVLPAHGHTDRCWTG